DMIAALEARDGARLATILRQHLLDKRDSVLLTLREGANQAAA
ncbi:MAG: GntR family transcriptional regulator, partial [Pseudomonadota bacterium]|nr:GntR family transcriptional regulator [Pseudomonadota bacterium]